MHMHTHTRTCDTSNHARRISPLSCAILTALCHKSAYSVSQQWQVFKQVLIHSDHLQWEEKE